MQISKNSMSVMKKLVRVKRKLITPKNKLQVIMEAAPHHIPVVAEAPVLVAVTVAAVTVVVVAVTVVDGLIQESTIRIKVAAATVVVKNRQEVTAIRCQRRWFVLNQANLLRGPSSIISTTRAVD